MLYDYNIRSHENEMTQQAQQLEQEAKTTTDKQKARALYLDAAELYLHLSKTNKANEKIFVQKATELYLKAQEYYRKRDLGFREFAKKISNKVDILRLPELQGNISDLQDVFAMAKNIEEVLADEKK